MNFAKKGEANFGFVTPLNGSNTPFSITTRHTVTKAEPFSLYPCLRAKLVQRVYYI